MEQTLMEQAFIKQILSLPAAGILLCIGAYLAGVLIRRRIRHPLANPLVIANVIIILVTALSPFKPEQFQNGARAVSLFIVPATTILGLRIYNQRAILRANLIPVLAGCAAGSASSIISVQILGRLFRIDNYIIFSLLPKSVTTAIAIDLSAARGGLAGITVSAVIITGIFSAFISPYLIKILKLKDPVAAGVAMGASGHAICTSIALEMGETQGAMSGIALSLMGIITSVFFVLFF
ncbi:MAG: LrgB family protein [Treponema sp.]|jgi:putative effector of murein hydrolase|nr:LrgB family protein [Treponema sp.]